MYDKEMTLPQLGFFLESLLNDQHQTRGLCLNEETSNCQSESFTIIKLKRPEYLECSSLLKYTYLHHPTVRQK